MFTCPEFVWVQATPQFFQLNIIAEHCCFCDKQKHKCVETTHDIQLEECIIMSKQHMYSIKVIVIRRILCVHDKMDKISMNEQGGKDPPPFSI